MGPESSSVDPLHGTGRDRSLRGGWMFVLDLCLEDTALDPEAWVSGNVPSGGQVFASDVGIAVYGSGEVRALEVAASGFALD